MDDITVSDRDTPPNRPKLANVAVAILATNGFEQSELTTPKKAIEEAGASVDVVSPEAGKIRGWNHTDWGDEVPVDRTLEAAHPHEYDAIVLPGGQINPDLLRVSARAIEFIQGFADQGKPIAAICHAGWLLAEAGLVKGRRLTSYPSIRTDMENAGADWVDEEVVRDRNIITSRKPDDLEAFCRSIIEALAERAPATQTAA